MSAPVRYEDDAHGVVTLVLDRSETRNALSDELLDAFLRPSSAPARTTRCASRSGLRARAHLLGGVLLKAFASPAAPTGSYDSLPPRYPAGWP